MYTARSRKRRQGLILLASVRNARGPDLGQGKRPFDLLFIDYSLQLFISPNAAITNRTRPGSAGASQFQTETETETASPDGSQSQGSGQSGRSNKQSGTLFWRRCLSSKCGESNSGREGHRQETCRSCSAVMWGGGQLFNLKSWRPAAPESPSPESVTVGQFQL